MATTPFHHSPMVTYLCGERDAQQEACHGHSQCYKGLLADDPLIAHLVHNGRDQRLQQAELCGAEGVACHYPGPTLSPHPTPVAPP